VIAKGKAVDDGSKRFGCMALPEGWCDTSEVSGTAGIVASAAAAIVVSVALDSDAKAAAVADDAFREPSLCKVRSVTCEAGRANAAFAVGLLSCWSLLSSSPVFAAFSFGAILTSSDLPSSVVPLLDGLCHTKPIPFRRVIISCVNWFPTAKPFLLQVNKSL